MTQPSKSEGKKGLSAGEGLALVVVGVFGLVVAFAALHFVATVIWDVVKVAVVVAVVGLVLWLLVRRH